jgi:hypothetical protein
MIVHLANKETFRKTTVVKILKDAMITIEHALGMLHAKVRTENP